MIDELSDLVEIAVPTIEWILIDAETIHDMDTIDVQGLEELIEELRDAGITLAFARPRNAVRVIMTSAGLIEMIGEENIYLETDDGVAAYLERSTTNGE